MKKTNKIMYKSKFNIIKTSVIKLHINNNLKIKIEEKTTNIIKIYITKNDTRSQNPIKPTKCVLIQQDKKKK